MNVDPNTIALVLNALGPSVQAFIAEARMLAVDGLTIQELGKLFNDGLHLAVNAASKVVTSSGADKKAMVLAVIGHLFDVVAPAIPMPFGLGLFRNQITPRLRQVVLMVAEGALETVVAKLPPPVTGSVALTTAATVPVPAA